MSIINKDKYIKKISAVFAAAIMVLSVSCGTGQTTTETTTGSVTTPVTTAAPVTSAAPSVDTSAPSSQNTPTEKITARGRVDGALTYNIYETFAEVASISCTNSAEITIPAEYNGLPVKRIAAKAAYSGKNGTKLRVISIPDGVEYIGDNAFMNTLLANITLPASVTSLGNGVFKGCTALVSANLGGGITSLPTETFHSCTSLKSADLNGINVIDSYAFYGCTSLENPVFPETLESINDAAYAGCSKITALELPKSLRHIGISAFMACSSLETVSGGDSLGRISSKAFAQCYALTTVLFPETIIYIGENAFKDCESLVSFDVYTPETRFTLKEGEELLETDLHIGTWAFDGCANLERFTLPALIHSIDGYAFFLCKNLKALNFHENLLMVEQYAFYGCESLDSIVFQSTGALGIGLSAFSGCSSLTSVTFESDTVLLVVNRSAFFLNEKLIKIVAPKDSPAAIALAEAGYGQLINNE